MKRPIPAGSIKTMTTVPRRSHHREVPTLYREAVVEAERLTDALAALAAALLRERQHPEAREVQTVACALHAQLASWAFRARVETLTDGEPS